VCAVFIAPKFIPDVSKDGTFSEETECRAPDFMPNASCASLGMTIRFLLESVDSAIALHFSE
jgi:hypothetical protein